MPSADTTWVRRLSLLTLLLALALPATALATTYKPRIVGGTEVVPGDYPWQVAVTTAGGGLCGGTLVAARDVVTAEHCEVAAGDEVRAGSYDRRSGGEVLTVEHVYRHHAAFAGGTFNSVWQAPRYDVNVLRLAAPVTDPKPLALVDADRTDLWEPGDMQTITGWGLQSSGGTLLPRYMREARVPIVSDTSCATAYAEFSAEDMVCAGYPAGGIDTCGGDSGGPIAAAVVASPSKTDPADWRLVGATSWGYGCAQPDAPGVYARLGDPDLGDWVRTVLATPPSMRTEVPRTEDEVPAELPPQDATTADEATPAAQPPATAPAATAPPSVALRVSRRCALTRRCTFTFTPRGAVATVRATVSTTLTRACVRRGRRTTCETVAVRALTVRKRGDVFATRAAKLRKGPHTLAVTPYGTDGKRLAAAKRYRFSVH